MRDSSITFDWYKEHFLREELEKQVFAMNGGLNMKTIGNKRQSTKKEIVIEETLMHYDKFIDLVESLVDNRVDIDLSLTLRGVTVHLNLNESIIIINALAVRRAAIRGGLWSTAGKQVEAPLMEVLCRLFEVDPRYFTRSFDNDGSLREGDFYLLPPQRDKAKCEVKLMGKGNPESADSVFARDSKVLVASTLSDTNKTQLDQGGILWTELQVRNGFLRFRETLRQLEIPHSKISEKQSYFADIERAVQSTFGIGA